MLGGRIATEWRRWGLNQRQLAGDRWQLEVNKAREAGSRQHLLSGRCTVEVEVYWCPAACVYTLATSLSAASDCRGILLVTRRAVVLIRMAHDQPTQISNRNCASGALRQCTSNGPRHWRRHPSLFLFLCMPKCRAVAPPPPPRTECGQQQQTRPKCSVTQHGTRHVRHNLNSVRSAM